MESGKKSKIVMWIGYILIVISLGPSLIFLMVSYKESLESELIREVSNQSNTILEYHQAQKYGPSHVSEKVK